MKRVIDFDNFLTDLNDVKIFFGKYDGIQRCDRFKYPISKKLTEIQQAQKWFPKELNYTRDKVALGEMNEGLAKIYQLNIGFQTVADSLANRFLDNILSEHITSPEWENVIKWQANFEMLHSESYSHTIREVYSDAEAFFNEILQDPKIRERLTLEIEIFEELSDENDFDSLTLKEKMRIVFKSLIAQYVLENIRFMVSFLYTFKINRITDNGIQGTANSIGLILNDEIIHTVIFRNLINILRGEVSEDFSWLFEEGEIQRTEEMIYQVFDDVINSELSWFDYLSEQADVPGMDHSQVSDFLYNYANKALKFIGLKEVYDRLEEPTELIAFFEEEKNISGKKVLAQENDITSYTIAALEDFDKENKLCLVTEVDNIIKGLFND